MRVGLSPRALDDTRSKEYLSSKAGATSLAPTLPSGGGCGDGGRGKQSQRDEVNCTKVKYVCFLVRADLNLFSD